MEDGFDYEVHTKLTFQLNFDGRGENNMLQLPDVRRAFVDHVKEVFAQDHTLSGNVEGDVTFHFNRRRVDMEYTFVCFDQNEAEAESFSEYSVRCVQEKLEEFGCKLKEIKCKAKEMDMAWLDELEDRLFGHRTPPEEQTWGGMMM